VVVPLAGTLEVDICPQLDLHEYRRKPVRRAFSIWSAGRMMLFMTFTGFRPSARVFLSGVGEQNTKTFFEAHRDEYISDIRQPLEDLLAEAQETYGPGRVTRPNRDVRFSKDKSPYKTTASMWAGDVGGVYLSVTATGLEVGGGLYDPSRDQLTRAREAIDSRPLVAKQLTQILDKINRDGFEVAGPSLKTAPRGFARDHPAIELLRLKHYAALKHLPLNATPDKIRATWTAVEPLIAWCSKNVGAAISGP
jgi:uncharacterized protein (TIGR02453 family)